MAMAKRRRISPVVVSTLEQAAHDFRSSEALRVRTPAGEVVLTMTADEVASQSVAQLRLMLAKAEDRCLEEVRLFAAFAELQDQERLAEIVALSEPPCEILAVASLLPQLDPSLDTLEQLPTIKALLLSSSSKYQLEAVKRLRKVLSMDQNPHLEEVLGMSILPRLVEVVRDSPTQEIVFESLWCLTNIAGGDTAHCQALVQSGALPVLAQHIDSEIQDHQEQALWVLGNIAGDSAFLRDTVIDAGVVPLICKALTDPSESTQSEKDQPVMDRTQHWVFRHFVALKLSFQRIAMWSISNLFRGRPKPDAKTLAPLLPVIGEVLKSTQDVETLEDTAWSLSFISEQDIESVLKLGVLPRLVQLMTHAHAAVCTPVVRTLGNIVSGNEGQTQAALDADILVQLPAVLAHQKASLRKEAAWLLSNITAGTSRQIAQVLSSSVLKVAIERIHDETHSVKKELAFIVANSISNGSLFVAEQLLEQGWLEKLLELILREVNPGLISIVLEFVENVLEAADSATEVKKSSIATRVKASLTKDDLDALCESDRSMNAEKARSLKQRLYEENDIPRLS